MYVCHSLYIHLFVDPSVGLLGCLSVGLLVCQFVDLSVCQSLSVSTCVARVRGWVCLPVDLAAIKVIVEITSVIQSV